MTWWHDERKFIACCSAATPMAVPYFVNFYTMMVIVHHFVISPLFPPTIVKYMLLGNFNVNNSSSRLILVNYDSVSLTEESPASLGYLVAESASKRLKVTIGRVIAVAIVIKRRYQRRRVGR